MNLRRRQRGQATVELVVLAFVLVPLFITIPLVGKYIDLQQAAEQASRYVAFEGIVRNTSSKLGSWKSDADLSTEVRRRFFGNGDASVKTGDAAGDFAGNRNPLWTDHAGHPLLDDFAADITVTTGAVDKNALSTAWAKHDLQLSESNLYTASVSVKPAKVAGFAPFDQIDLSTTRRTVLLADAWTGTDSAAVRKRIEDAGIKLYPVGAAKSLVNVLGQLPPIVFDPALKVGEFDWDIVPCDRLGGC